MQLEYSALTGAFFLKVPREDKLLVKNLMQDHGLDFSVSASTSSEAVLFTHEPYCAVTFDYMATPEAQAQLAALSAEIATSWAMDSGAHIDCPPDQQLWGFQKADISYALQRKNTLVGDQPGLGKTPIAICFANEIRAKRVLVVCPASIRLQWARRIREWSTMPWPFIVHPIINSRHGVHPTAQWTIVSYELARQPAIQKALLKGTYDLMILDEAHYVKTRDSRRTRALFGGGRAVEGTEHLGAIADRAGSIMALTGTPLPNRPREAYTLARGLCLAADTVVLTDRGPTPIVDVQPNDRLWDGEAWVGHTGIVSNGRKPVLRKHGVGMTAEHQVMCGGTWNTWSNVLGDDGTQSLAWETGLESFRSLATLMGRAASALLSNVPAGASPIGSLRPMPATGTIAAASAVETNDLRPPPSDTPQARPTLANDDCSSHASAASSVDAATRMTPAMPIMANAALRSGRHGSPIEVPSLNTSTNSPAGPSREFSSIDVTTSGDMNQGTSGGSALLSTARIKEQSQHWNAPTENSEPVYDILNAGPNHRFTILTEAGPLVVHNCWDSIDWMSEDKFGARFNPILKTERETADGRTVIFKDERTGRHAELQNRLRANFMTRHLKRDVMTQLQLPTYDLIQLEETSAVKQALEAESMLDIDPENLEGADAAILGDVSTVRKQMGIALAPQVADYVDMLLDGGEEKIVLFAWHIEVLDILCERLAKWNPVRVDGATGAIRKELRIKEFIEDPKCQLIIGNVLSLGTGTDGLQHVANHALIAEPSWVPGENIQCFDRLDRGGQTRAVQGDIFVAPNSLAERVLASSLRKLKTTHKALDAQRPI